MRHATIGSSFALLPAYRMHVQRPIYVAPKHGLRLVLASKVIFMFSKVILSRNENQPKEEVLGRTSLQTSGQTPRSGPPNPGDKQAFWHGHASQTSPKNFSLKSFWLIFCSLTKTTDFTSPKDRLMRDTRPVPCH